MADRMKLNLNDIANMKSIIPDFRPVDHNKQSNNPSGSGHSRGASRRKKSRELDSARES